MAVVVAGLHIVGFLTLILVAGSRHRGAATAGTLSLGIGFTAYTLGMRHAFDADHISAIDNTTRKLMQRRASDPMSVGFFFSLGHSSIVFILSVLLNSVGIRALDGPVRNDRSSLHQVTSWIGTLVSGSFLYLIALINVVILVRIVRVFVAMLSGLYDEQQLEAHLAARGLANRLFGRLTSSVVRPSQMYPIGVLFGLGFDTATEVALLVLAGGAAGTGLPWYGILSPCRRCSPPACPCSTRSTAPS